MTDRPASTAPLAAGLPLVKGRCPACGTSGLFLGDGGYVTCSLIDCPNPSAADELLHRLRPTTALSEHLTETIDEAFNNNYQPGVGLDTAAMTTAVLAALTDHLDIGDAEAWCKTCRRVWDGRRHRCESDAEAAIGRVRALAERIRTGGNRYTANDNDIAVFILLALDEPTETS